MFKKVLHHAAMLLFVASLINIHAMAFSATVDNDLTEANAFFNELLEQTDNPVIARFAKENLRHLDSSLDTEDKGYQLLSSTAIQVAAQPSKINDTAAVEIPLLKGTYSRNLVVPALLNKTTTGTFIVDTGATFTVITPQLASEMGVVIDKATPKMSILTANGWIQAPVVTIHHMSLGDVQIDDVQAVVQDLGGDPNLSGLLGMNFFKDIELTIRRDKLILRISSN